MLKTSNSAASSEATASADAASALSEQERKDVSHHHSLNSISVYAVVHREGLEELKRPLMSLWFSGVAAGIGISSSVLAEGILHEVFTGSPHQFALENLGYTVGFVLVILGRLQLFTENTITAILPLLGQRSLQMLWCTMRLWTIVFAANMVGSFLSAGLGSWLGTVPADYVDGMAAISRHYAGLAPFDAFAHGIPAGFFVAAIVWMMPAARSASVFVIMIFTYLIAMGDFTHVVAGSTELFVLLIRGEVTAAHSAALIAATLLGNIAGGSGLFALLAYGQVVSELDR